MGHSKKPVPVMPLDSSPSKVFMLSPLQKFVAVCISLLSFAISVHLLAPIVGVPTTSLVHIDHNNSIDYKIINYNVTDVNITDYLNPPSLMGVDESVPLGGAVVYNLLPATCTAVGIQVWRDGSSPHTTPMEQQQLFPTNCTLQEPHGSSQVLNLRCELHGTRLPVSNNLYPVSLTSGSGQLNYKKAATDSASSLMTDDSEGEPVACSGALQPAAPAACGCSCSGYNIDNQILYHA